MSASSRCLLGGILPTPKTHPKSGWRRALRALRESIRLLQAKLAKKIGTSQSALARYEPDDAAPTPELLLLEMKR